MTDPDAANALAVAQFNELHQVGHIVWVSCAGRHGAVRTTGPAKLDPDGVPVVPVEKNAIFGDCISLGFVKFRARTASYDEFWQVVGEGEQ